jgi:integrase
LDEHGRPIRGKDQRQAADLALARVKATGRWRPQPSEPPDSQWLVARVCSEYIAHCQRRLELGEISDEYCKEVSRHLNDLCQYCGAISVSEVRKGHIEHWVESHTTWRSPVTRRHAMTSVLAAFRYARQMHDVSHSLVGLKKPPQRPRLASFTTEEETLLYSATDEVFGNFLFAAIHTGLRPYCELARLTTDDVRETERGMMWRVDSTKTGKVRVIPVRSEVAALTRQLIDGVPARSAVFRNNQGRPWKKVTGVARFLKIKRDLDWASDPRRAHLSSYSCRHTFAHRMLAGYWNDGLGCSIEVLAELLGDTPAVAFAHYGREWGQHFQDPLWRAIGVAD